ncbi:MAG: phytanoyl-CoA dioxygenase family protein [Hyphomicrobiaceae bacterium]|nr:phytanoyl-CoA dioxygenase family protein [Hyphomicrobiaceae bacterium]
MTEFRRTIQNSLLDNGYFVFERFADRDQVRNIRSIVVDFFESNNALIHDYKYDPPGTQARHDRGAHPLGLFDPRLGNLRNMVKPEILKDLLEDTFPTSQFTEAFHSDIHWNFGGTGTPLWHRDNEIRPFATDATKDFVHNDYNVYRSALYLEDHDEKTALQVIPGSHRNKNDPQFSDELIKTCNVEAGDLILFHCSLYHRSQNCSVRDRIIVFFAHGEENIYTRLHGEYVRNRIQARLGCTLEEYLAAVC